ncbi:MAG: flavodoxin family protein [Candidatus Omnitrophica bacterium]|nr:flavodoxin family protein [Candidatus Omnitrophota bacterium]
MIKILGILGSPRIGGNNEVLLRKVLSHLNNARRKTQLIKLRDLDIAPCNSCNGCYNSARCVIKDDIEKVFKKIEDSDVIILGSPVFFLGVSAQTKILVDRSQPKWIEKYILKKTIGPSKTKKGIFISIRGGKGKEIFRCVEKPIRAFFDVHNIKYEKGIFLDGIDEKGAIMKNKKTIKNTIEEVARIIEDRRYGKTS